MNSTTSEPEIELELTYLASKIPDELSGVSPDRLVDIYIPDTGVDHPHLRLRKKGDVCQITKKVPATDGDASTQIEMTIPLDEQEFAALSVSSTKQVVKDRYNVTIDGHPAEVDVFLDGLGGLILIDFEFTDQASKQNFIPPDICKTDVTQEDFVAGGMLAGKTYADIESDLQRLGYQPIKLPS